MGWTWYKAEHLTKHGKIDRKAEVDEIFGPNYKVLKSQMVGSTYYGAIKNLKTGVVSGTVCLTQTDQNQFGYKDIDETCGPGYYKCPKSILDLLSPTSDKWANEWREECRKNLAKPKLADLPIGSEIKFTYSDGEEVHLIKYPPNHQFKTDWWKYKDRYNYMIKKYIPNNWELV